MEAAKFTEILGADFFTGVPDSQLKALCNYLMKTYGTNAEHHVIAANEGNCMAIAAGYHLATGKIPVVYMQNSGEGNAINPLASLLNEKVYGIPCIMIVGWRGEPGVHDEPQHIYQGEITGTLLDDMGIKYSVLDKNTTEEEVCAVIEESKAILQEGKQIAFVVKKGALVYNEKVSYGNDNIMLREEVIRHIVRASEVDIIVSTTGKASRELFEIREQNGQSHKYDFLTVGSMGHSSSIAFGIAVQQKDRRVWCIDGDGAASMHMGAMAMLGAYKPDNLIHIVINNGAHETVGGMPTVASKICLAAVAEACGYPNTATVSDYGQLDEELAKAKRQNGLYFIEVMCDVGAREDLGRPTLTTHENKENFMGYLAE